MYPQSFSDRPPAFYGALVTVTLLPLYLGSYRYRLWHPYGGKDAFAATPPDPGHFVADWLDVHVVQPFNPSAIASYCDRTEWHPNLVFNLANEKAGSSTELRGSVLDFVFYAIEAGASIVLPSFGTNGSLITQDKMVFGLMYDEAWLVSSMKQACPQMAIYRPEEDHKIAGALTESYMPKSRRMDIDQGNTKKAYLEHLDMWLRSKPEFKPDELTLVNIESTQWQVDTRSLPQGLRRDFGQVLRVSLEIRRFAATVVQELALRYHTPIDPRLVLPKHAFYGAHIRTKSDASGEPYSNISAQAQAHIDRAIKHQLRLIYVASENATDLAKFKIAAAQHTLPLIAVSKYDLLSAEHGTALKQLNAAQQALVDLEVLKRCTLFGGSVQSGSSYSIAMSRNQWLVDHGKINDPWFVVHMDTGVTFDDGLSRIIGRDGVSEQQMPRGSWP